MDEHAMLIIIPENLKSQCEGMGKKKREFSDVSTVVTCLSLICSIFPSGLFAVRYANQAKEAYRLGKWEEADKLTREALLVTATTVLTPVILALTIIILLFYT